MTLTLMMTVTTDNPLQMVTTYVIATSVTQTLQQLQRHCRQHMSCHSSRLVSCAHRCDAVLLCLLPHLHHTSHDKTTTWFTAPTACAALDIARGETIQHKNKTIAYGTAAWYKDEMIQHNTPYRLVSQYGVVIPRSGAMFREMWSSIVFASYLALSHPRCVVVLSHPSCALRCGMVSIPRVCCDVGW